MSSSHQDSLWPGDLWAELWVQVDLQRWALVAVLAQASCDLCDPNCQVGNRAWLCQHCQQIPPGAGDGFDLRS